MDPAAAEYPNINPYTYVANNPINAIDPDGRKIVFTGGSKALNKVQNTINQGLGGNYATVDKSGNVTLNVSESVIANMTSEQKGFFNVVESAVNHEKTTSINVVESANGVVAGSLSGKVIDIDDIDNFGSGELMNSTTVLGHEIHEQYQQQALGNTVGSNVEKTGAHDKAVAIESTMNGGWVRGTSITDRREPSEFVQKNQLGGGTIKGKAANYTSKIPFTNPKGEVKNFTYEVKNGNVVNKSN